MSTGCSDDTPSIDPRCEDEAFAEANPTLCTNYQRLYLVPSQALVAVGDNVEYTLMLRTGSTEMEIERGIAFTVANVGVAVINEDGVATGVTAGISTVRAEWQGMTAHAQIEVVQSCTEVETDYVILIDNSKSMTQAAYTAASKLAFAKLTASQWCNSINYSKDRVAAYRFNATPTRIIDFQTEAPTIQAAISGIASSTGKTDIGAAIQAASDYLGDSEHKAMLLFSDGENNDGSDPLPIAKAFKEAGGVIIVVATRAWGVHFELLNKIASGGFFLSAHEETESLIANTLAGIKSLICGGNCTPEPGVYPTAQLNYTGWINWNVTAGRVDLVGLGHWDVQPGNGLYADLQGTGDEGYPSPGQDFGFGQLTSKVEYDFVDGEDYSFELSVGGSSGPGAGTWTIRVRVGDGVDELITINIGNSPLTPQLFEWTQVGDFTGPIIIEQTVQTGHYNIGTLIDEITLRNETDDEVMLYDNFDGENPTEIPPGDYSYLGCADGPPGSQHADLTPPGLMVE